METTITAINNTGSHRTIDLLIGEEVPGKDYNTHYCPHNNTTYLNVCDGDGGIIDPTYGWTPRLKSGKKNLKAEPWSKVSRSNKNKKINEYVKEQYELAGISVENSSPAPAASNAAVAAPASSGNGLALASAPTGADAGASAGAGGGANAGCGLNNGLVAALLSSGLQLVHLPSGPAGAGQYLINPSSGASFAVQGGNALPSGGHGIGFGLHVGADPVAGAGACASAMPSTPTAASTPSRGGLGAAAAAAGGGAAAANGSGAGGGIMKVAHHPAGPEQYLVNPSSGASFPVQGGNAFFSGRGIGFGPHEGAAAGGAMPSTPTAASTPSRGGLGAAAAAGGGGGGAAAAATSGSGAGGGVKNLVPEGWQVIWLSAGPAGPGQYLLDPHGQMLPYVEGGNAFAPGYGLGFGPCSAAAMPSTPVQNKVACSSAPFFGSFPNKFNGGGISTPQRIPTVIPDDVSNGIPSEAPLPPAPRSTAASKKDVDRLTTLMETSIEINKQNQDENNTNWDNFKAFAGHMDDSLAHVAEEQKGMNNNIAKNASGIAKNASDIAELKKFQQKYEASHGS